MSKLWRGGDLNLNFLKVWTWNGKVLVLLLVSFLGGLAGWKLYPVFHAPAIKTEIKTVEKIVTRIQVVEGVPKVVKEYITVHTNTPSINTPPAVTEGTVPFTYTPGQPWAFKDAFSEFKYIPESNQITYAIKRDFSIRMTHEVGKSEKSATLVCQLFELRDGKEFLELPVKRFELVEIKQSPASPRFIALEHSFGIGISVADWDTAKPAFTYSFLRVSRFKVPSVMIDLGKNLGVGLQYKMWKPFHAGAFYAVNLDDTTVKAFKFTFTGNF